MATQTVLKCNYCKDQFVSSPVKLLYNGDQIDLCSSQCWIKFFAQLYHQAMASGEQLECWLPEPRGVKA